jgi:tetratricopeptide (TPR) repeat protein
MSSVERPRPDRVRTIRRIFALLILALGAGGVAWGVWESSRARSSLDDAIALADAGKLDEAGSRMRAIVARHPDDGTARLLLAQFLMKRPDPLSPSAKGGRSSVGVAEAEEALGHLAHVHPDKPSMAAAFHLSRGNALYSLSRLEEAEADWLKALHDDPTTPEAGWNLLNLYYIQAREADARGLALRLFAVEPDPHDRALLLLELVRPTARPPAPGSIVQVLEPVVRDHPGEFHSAIAYGLALVRSGQADRGIDELRRVASAYPERVEGWDSLLTCLDEAGQVDAMDEALKRIPGEIAATPRLARHRARVAQAVNRWKEAVELYRQACRAEPSHGAIQYRLSRALRQDGQRDEAARIEVRLRRRDAAAEAIRPLYEQADATRDLRVRTQALLFQKIAQAREDMGLADEAIAWHRLILAEDPANEVSRSALARLEPGTGHR